MVAVAKQMGKADATEKVKKVDDNVVHDDRRRHNIGFGGGFALG